MTSLSEAAAQSGRMPQQEHQTKKQKSKRRWSRAEKEAHRQQRQQKQWMNGTPRTPRNEKKPKKVLSPSERLLQCAEKARFTGSVNVIPSDRRNTANTSSEALHNDTRQQQRQQELNIHVSTFCRHEPPTASQSIPRNTSHVIQHQPLLILDLNGILCHRIRHAHQKSPKHYRPSVAHIAQTPIITRINLHDFLLYLNNHFCLAVWTSAKPKTAKSLVNLLFPPLVKERLLFVWAQSKCLVISQDDDNAKPLFQKPLSKVWTEYPLWNERNTFILDDSPNKCDLQFATNTLHPPPLNGKLHLFHGLHGGSGMMMTSNNTMSDMQNEELQFSFFQALTREIDSGRDLQDFMNQHARGHMGWRGPSVVETSNGESVENDNGVGAKES